MVTFGPLITVILTQDTLTETVHGGRNECDRLYYGSFDRFLGLYGVFFHMDRYVLGTVIDMVQHEDV